MFKRKKIFAVILCAFFLLSFTSTNVLAATIYETYEPTSSSAPFTTPTFTTTTTQLGYSFGRDVKNPKNNYVHTMTLQKLVNGTWKKVESVSTTNTKTISSSFMNIVPGTIYRVILSTTDPSSQRNVLTLYE